MQQQQSPIFLCRMEKWFTQCLHSMNLSLGLFGHQALLQVPHQSWLKWFVNILIYFVCWMILCLVQYCPGYLYNISRLLWNNSIIWYKWNLWGFYFCQSVRIPCKVLPFISADLEFLDRYINYLLGFPSISGSVVEGPTISPVVLGAKQMENAVAKTAATFLWLGVLMIRS